MEKKGRREEGTVYVMNECESLLQGMVMYCMYMYMYMCLCRQQQQQKTTNKQIG